jgi:thioredoxin-like negative regulator of GroEL
LALVESGMRHDCIHQSGCRRNDFELRRAQIHLQSGDLDAARDLFTQLVDRVPSNLDVLGQAAEAMLSMQQPTPAREFAQRGLFLAEKAGDRDRVGYFAELCHAAMRQAAPV